MFSSSGETFAYPIVGHTPRLIYIFNGYMCLLSSHFFFVAVKILLHIRPYHFKTNYKSFRSFLWKLCTKEILITFFCKSMKNGDEFVNFPFIHLLPQRDDSFHDTSINNDDTTVLTISRKLSVFPSRLNLSFTREYFHRRCVLRMGWNKMLKAVRHIADLFAFLSMWKGTI